MTRPDEVLPQEAGEQVIVEAHARLHFGVLDLRGGRRRWFGGIGAAAPGPTLLVSASAADGLEVDGADAERAAEFARRFVSYHGLRGGARMRVHRALPSHAGLGSGTQLALAVARALAEVHGIEADVRQLARAVERGRRSAIGVWTFAGGGLVVEGGHRSADPDGPADRKGPRRTVIGPLLTRLPFPPSWRCVVAVPDAASGLSGTDEAAAFEQLAAPPDRDVEQIAHLVLMMLLPAVADGDIEGFGAALTQIQEMTGRWFAPVQGGTFAAGPSEALVRRMREWGASGVGQSSWGPAVYGIVAGEAAGTRLADRVRDAYGSTCAVYEGAFPEDGARIWTGHTRARAPGESSIS
jgi:beta-ribofuranosylaminobenzene 5'-phosphate synthase